MYPDTGRPQRDFGEIQADPTKSFFTATAVITLFAALRPDFEDKSNVKKTGVVKTTKSATEIKSEVRYVSLTVKLTVRRDQRITTTHHPGTTHPLTIPRVII